MSSTVRDPIKTDWRCTGCNKLLARIDGNRLHIGSVNGRDICRMFTGFAIREFGDAAFRVSRADNVPHAKAEGTPSWA